MRASKSPSETIKSIAAIEEVVRDPSGPRYGRPSDRFGPPTALFSPELALLKYDLEHLETFAPGNDIANYAFALIESSAKMTVKGKWSCGRS